MAATKLEQAVIIFLSLTLTILCFVPLCPFFSPFLEKPLSFFRPTNYDIDDTDKSLNNANFHDDSQKDIYPLNTAWPEMTVEEKDNVEPTVDTDWSDPLIISTLPGDLEEVSLEPEMNEEDVVVLTGNNFTRLISEQKYVMVNFYAPWCSWSNKLAPEYAMAAKLLKDTEAVLAKVDAITEPRLRTLLKVHSYPAMMLFIDGGAEMLVYDSSENRTRDAIANWVRLKVSPHVQTIATATPQEVQHLLTAKPTIVFAFLETLEDPVSEELTTVSKLHLDTEFYQTTNVDVARLFDIDPQVIQRPALFLFKRDDEEMNYHTGIRLSGDHTSLAMSDFVLVHKLPYLIKITTENAPLILDNPKKQLWLFSPKCSDEVTSTFKRAAIAFKGQVMAYMAKGNPDFQIYDGESTLSGIKSFVNEFLEDKLMARSPPIPDSYSEGQLVPVPARL